MKSSYWFINKKISYHINKYKYFYANNNNSHAQLINSTTPWKSWGKKFDKNHARIASRRDWMTRTNSYDAFFVKKERKEK